MASTSKVTLSLPPNHGVRLIFGTMTFAGQVDEGSAIEQLETFFGWHPAASYVELDTAFMYEDTKTEQMLGRILTEEQKSRMRIATKGRCLLLRYCVFVSTIYVSCIQIIKSSKDGYHSEEYVSLTLSHSL